MSLIEMNKPRRKSLVGRPILTASLEWMLWRGFTLFLTSRMLILARWFVGALEGRVHFILNRRWAFCRRDVSSTRLERRYGVIAISLGTIL